MCIAGALGISGSTPQRTSARNCYVSKKDVFSVTKFTKVDLFTKVEITLDNSEVLCTSSGMVGAGQGKSTLFLEVAAVELTAATVVVISS